uniref:Rho-GAP domain-containing protein n=1 Tax=Trichobilharzia regenti TaxID=157069 RepID=A0AA85JUZ5_TRIRE|nr:unnamed protein product [Trichobilharzia regenti]
MTENYQHCKINLMSDQLSKPCKSIQDLTKSSNIQETAYNKDAEPHDNCSSSFNEDEVRTIDSEQNHLSSYHKVDHDAQHWRFSDSLQHTGEHAKGSPIQENVLPQASPNNQSSNGVRWRHYKNNGQEMYINEKTDETWIPATDQYGKTYYYELNSRHSVWTLEDLDTTTTTNTDTSYLSDSLNNYLDSNGQNPACDDFNYSIDGDDEDHVSVIDEYPSMSKLSSTGEVKRRIMNKTKKSNRISNSSVEVSPTPVLSRPFSLVSLDDGEQGTGRFQMKNLSKEHISGPHENKLTHFERRGSVIRTILIENDKRISKKWTPGVLLLSGPLLLIYKDNKTILSKINQPQCKPDIQFNIREIEISEANGEQTSRKNVLKIDYNISGKLNVYLVQIPAIDYESWKAAIRYAKDLLKEDRGVTLTRSITRRDAAQPSMLDSKLLAKLRDFFRTRPTAASLRSRGILKNESVFASTIMQVCENESSDVPNFVVRAIRAIEARGLDHIGIYRLSGNGATIQKLRCAVNQYNYSLNSEKWSLEVLTGALKLFFRELKEPLITFKIYPEIASLLANKEMAPDRKVAKMRDLINSMPAPHVNTSRILFHHLYRVMQLSEMNQMHSYKLAIVFGPSLLWPEVDSAAFGALTSVQAPCVEFLLIHVEEIFGPVTPPPVIS